MNIFCTFSGCIADKPQPLFFYAQFWGKSVDYLPVFNVFQVQNNQGRSILILRLCRDTIIALYSSRFPWILKQHLKQLLERLNPICTRNGGHDQNFRKQQRLEFLSINLPFLRDKRPCIPLCISNECLKFTWQESIPQFKGAWCFIFSWEIKFQVSKIKFKFQMMKQTAEKDNTDHIPFTLTFHPHNHAVKSIILKNFKLLQNDSETGTIFS